MSACKKRSRNGKRVSASTNTADATGGSGNLQIVPVTRQFVQEYLSNVEKINESFQNDQVSASFFLEQAHSILAETDELSAEFTGLTKQNGLLGSMIQLLLKPSLSLGKQELLCTVLAMLASNDSEIYNALHRVDVISALVRPLSVENAKTKEILAVAQFLELLLEDNGALLNVLSGEDKARMIAFAKIPCEASLCVAGALQQEMPLNDLFSSHFDFLNNNKEEVDEEYVAKFFKVLTNHFGEESAPKEIIEKLIYLLIESRPEINFIPSASASLANLMANVVPSLGEEELMQLNSVFESVVERLRHDPDEDVVEGASNMMRSLSLTGIWAAEAADIAVLAGHPESLTVMYNLVPICYYAMKHECADANQVHEILQSLTINGYSKELEEEAKEALKKLQE